MSKVVLLCCIAVLPLLPSCSSSVSAPTLVQADSDGNGIISPTEDAIFRKAQEIAGTAPSAPSTQGVGNVTNTIRNTASTVGIVRNLQTIFGGF